MKLDWIRRIVQPKPAVAELTSVRRGTQHVKGVVKSGPELLRSPYKGVSCVAFFCRAYYQVQGRTGMTETNLKAIGAHTPVFFHHVSVRQTANVTLALRSANLCE